MNNKLLSIAIIVLAAAIVFVNLWKPTQTQVIKDSPDSSTGQVKSEKENIPGADLSEVQEGKPAPDFELATINGDKIRLSDYKGKKVILNLWATWCPPCKAEMPHMQNFYEKNKNKGIEILAVNLTSMDKGTTEIQNFVGEYGLTFEIPLDVDGTIGIQYQAFSIPTSYIIDSNGVIAKKIVGPMDESMMQSLTKEIE
ncbi:peroxiredoxin family protein [Mesobacillus foraminis]|uniref:peroxiredoxin family protein n=1 Tax=Mesobacillus foraminis TaxID=279826 RepID=UPI000EF475C1|nr:redoxin domain-containing protein [Mesobacillus foraminis]